MGAYIFFRGTNIYFDDFFFFFFFSFFSFFSSFSFPFFSLFLVDDLFSLVYRQHSHLNLWTLPLGPRTLLFLIYIAISFLSTPLYAPESRCLSVCTEGRPTIFSVKFTCFLNRMGFTVPSQCVFVVMGQKTDDLRTTVFRQTLRYIAFSGVRFPFAIANRIVTV